MIIADQLLKGCISGRIRKW